MLRIDVITIFPELFGRFLEASILGHACREGQIAVAVHDLREWTRDRHRTVDDRPYGGGPGMVMAVEPLRSTIRSAKDRKVSTWPLTKSANSGPAMK